jgi:hypothetical protein
MSEKIRRLSSKEVTKAVARYCRKHGHSAAFVRTNTQAMNEAIREWVAAHPVST